MMRSAGHYIGKLLGLAINKGAAVQEYVAGVLDDVTFRNLGIVQGDPQAPRYAEKQWSAFVLKPPVAADLLITDACCHVKQRWAGQKFCVVFTDGSVKLQNHPWLAHAGWGIFAGPGSCANDWGHLEGPPFTSYRAELRGLLEAFSRAVAPTWVVCDNQAVCDQAASLIAKLEAMRSDHPHKQDLELTTPVYLPECDEMWKSLSHLIERAPRNFYKVSWMPSHLTDSGKEAQLEEYLLQGGSMLWAQGNRGADILADNGALSAAPASSLLWKDHIVKQLAKVVHTMQAMVWASFKGHVCGDLELTAASMAQECGNEHEPDWNNLAFEDPFMDDFLCQDDREHDSALYEPDLFSEFVVQGCDAGGPVTLALGSCNSAAALQTLPSRAKMG